MSVDVGEELLLQIHACNTKVSDASCWAGFRRLTNSHGGVSKARNPAAVEAIAFQSPGLVCVIQERLAIVGDGLAVSIDQDSRIVILGASRPLWGHIDLFGVSCQDGTVIFEGNRSSPEGGYAGTRWLQKRRDFLQRFEIIPWKQRSVIFKGLKSISALGPRCHLLGEPGAHLAPVHGAAAGHHQAVRR